MSDDSETRRRYTGTAIDISYDPAVCIHAAECVKGLPTVFDTKAKPWINPDGATPDEVIAQIARCPSGALRAEQHDA